MLIIPWLAVGSCYGQQKKEGLAIGNEIVVKEVAIPLSNTLEKVKQLNAYTYTGKNQLGTKGERIGIITRDVEKVFPQLIYALEDGTKKVNYSGLIPVLVEAIKEQQLLIDQLISTADGKEVDYQQLKETIKKQSEMFKKQKKWLGQLQLEKDQLHAEVELIKMSLGLEASIDK